MITSEFIEQYLGEKEALLTQYMLSQGGAYSLRKASSYLQKLSDTLFGNPKHGGLVNYLMEQPGVSQNIDDVMALAESYFGKGWHVAPIQGRYWLMSGEFKRVADVSGAQNVYSPVPASLGVEDASLFLTPEQGEKLKSAAARRAIPPQNLKSPLFTLEFIQKDFSMNKDLVKLAKNYASLGKILEKTTAYPCEDPSKAVTIEDIYTMGYRLESKLNPSDAAIVYVTNGMNDLMIRKAVINESANIIAANALSRMMPKFVVKEDIIEMEEMSQVYGIVFKKEPQFFDSFDFYDNELILKGLYSRGHVPKEYTNLLEKNLYTYLLARLVLFGDLHMNLNSFCLNSVNGMIYSRYTGTFYTLSEDVLRSVSNSIDGFTPADNLLSAISVSDKQSISYLATLIKTLATKADLQLILNANVEPVLEKVTYTKIAKAVIGRLNS